MNMNNIGRQTIFLPNNWGQQICVIDIFMIEI